MGALSAVASGIWLKSFLAIGRIKFEDQVDVVPLSIVHWPHIGSRSVDPRQLGIGGSYAARVGFSDDLLTDLGGDSRFVNTTKPPRTRETCH